MDERFTLVGIHPPRRTPARPGPRQTRRLSLLVILLAVLLGCLFCEGFLPHDPAHMDLSACNLPPGREFWFGTDAMGRDLFSMIWYGGRISLLIGALAAAVSGAVAVLVGTAAGLGPKWLDGLLMRLTEILLSVPELLLILLLQGILDTRNQWGLALVIGLASWTGLAKVVRTEVRQLRTCGYVLASRCMGGGFFHLLRWHLAPNLIPSTMYMVAMNFRSAIAAEATLSFLGLGLPLEVTSWGSLLALSQRSMLGGAWWGVLFPGVFLVTVLLCVTGLGDDLRKHANRQESNL